MAKTIIHINLANVSPTADIEQLAATIRSMINNSLGADPAVRINDTNNLNTIKTMNIVEEIKRRGRII